MSRVRLAEIGNMLAIFMLVLTLGEPWAPLRVFGFIFLAMIYTVWFGKDDGHGK